MMRKVLFGEGVSEWPPRDMKPVTEEEADSITRTDLEGAKDDLERRWRERTGGRVSFWERLEGKPDRRAKKSVIEL